MNRWRVTHIAPTGRRHRLVLEATTNTAATAQALLTLGEALVLSCIRLTADSVHLNQPTLTCPTC